MEVPSFIKNHVMALFDSTGVNVDITDIFVRSSVAEKNAGKVMSVKF